MLAVFLINSLIITLAVLIHYEFLFRISTVLPKMKIKHRFRIVFGVFGALVAHSIEIWLFAVAYYLLPQIQSSGYLEGNFDGSLMDCVYFSYTTFTTLGFGDIEPQGQLHFYIMKCNATGIVHDQKA